MGKQQHTQYYSTTPTPREVTITRRHHPLAGQTVQLLQGGRRRLVVRVGGGMVMRLPRDWTDADGVNASASAHATVFSVESLRELGELTEALRRRTGG